MPPPPPPTHRVQAVRLADGGPLPSVVFSVSEAFPSCMRSTF
jgi:hypothetical protein